MSATHHARPQPQPEVNLTTNNGDGFGEAFFPFRATLVPGAASNARDNPVAALAGLRKALRRERARGRAGHWTYDLSRHLALAQDVRRLEATLRAALFAAPVATPV